MPRRLLSLLLIATSLLAGCDLLGIEPASAIAAQKEAEGKAIGAACRQAARAMEDCFALNRKADKAAIYAGWREMSDYMRENKIEPVSPQLGAADKKADKADKAEVADAEKPDTAADKATDKATDKAAADKPAKAAGKKPHA
jgi:hypothetical protein